MKNILAHGHVLAWKDIFGAPGDSSSQDAETMNRNPEVASKWNGSVLIGIEMEDSDKPVKMIEKIGPS